MAAKQAMLTTSSVGRTVELAGEVGFCFGVRRAINLTHRALDAGGPVFIFGDLVHNRNVTDDLERKGLRKVKAVDGAAGGTMVIRAHGLPLEEIEHVREQGLEVVDATCPIVHRAQEAAQTLEERGCQVVIIGDAQHAEIKGIVGVLRKPALIVNSIDELRAAKAERRLARKVGVIFQTTHALELCKDMIGEIVFMCKEVQIINTVCRPVQDRQDDAIGIAERCDLMLVVGSTTSANTMELAELCRAHNPWTLHLQSADDLNEADFVWASRIGIASGLSTPVDVVEAVRTKVLESEKPVQPELRPDPEMLRHRAPDGHVHGT
jgi:4-hydroxy-3-methylbut-2-enyl diphosphate reductase